MIKLVHLYSLLLLLSLCLTGKVFSQGNSKYYSKEISFKTDNDAYLFTLKDAYYTNGFFFDYAWVSATKKVKKIQRVELGQMIYTPLKRATRSTTDIDRPYCGYLFLKYQQTTFLNHKTVFRPFISIGLLGRASGGEGLQNTYHQWLGYAKFTGWKYQISNAISFDMGMAYAKTIQESNGVKLMGTAELNLGTTFTNVKLGGMLITGAFEQNEESALWNARIGSKAVTSKRKYEFFGYWHPQLIAQGYNATIQGGIWGDKGMASTSTISPWVFQQNIGLCYANGRFTTKLEYIYQTKETPSQIRVQRYGAVQINYRIM